MQRIKQLNLYIPKNIDIDGILEENPPQFKAHRDCFLYILHLITSIPVRRKDMDIEKNNGFTPINKKYLQKRIREYGDYIDYLIKHGIVEEDKQYIVGEKSSGLRFAEKYQSEIRPVKVTKWTLIKSILYLRTNSDEEAKENLPYLKRWFGKNIQVDWQGASGYLLTEYEKEKQNPEIKFPSERHNQRLCTVMQLANKEYFFEVDKTAGRLHTPFTQLKSELRKYIKYDGKQLCNVDIVNSQPYLATTLLDENLFHQNRMEERLVKYNQNYSVEKQNQYSKTSTYSEVDNEYYQSSTAYNPIMVVKFIEENQSKEDVLLFRELVTNGSFYEEFSQILRQQSNTDSTAAGDRKLAKKSMFSALFSRNTSIGFKQEMRDFKNNFPHVYEIMSQVKKNQHNALACLLQNFEAELILWKSCKSISDTNPNIPLFTIHDSIVTTVEHAEFVKSIMIEELGKALGEPPKIKIEYWE